MELQQLLTGRRMLPDHLAAKVHADRWPVPPLLAWLKRAGQLSAVEFARTWNTGLGIVLVVDETEVDQVLSLLAATDETVFRIGELVQRPTGETGCIIENLAAWNQ